jgi:LPXTG-motif cell wall-anchored protein
VSGRTALRWRRFGAAAGAIGAAVFAAASFVGVPSASAAPTACAPAPSYGVGVAILPEFVGTDDPALAAFPGEVIDYDVTVFLTQDPLGMPNRVIVCPISEGTLTVTLPDGSGPFTIATGITLPVGGSITYENVPGQKYTMNAAHVVTAPGCEPGAPCYDRIQATAHVEATSDGPDDGPQDNAPVQATATAPTFLLAPSTRLTVTPNASAVSAGAPVQWTVTETNDTPPRVFPVALSDVHVDLSTDGGASTFARLDTTSPSFSGDTDLDGQLDVGETWMWTLTTNPTANTTLTATGFGTGPRAHVVTFPADAEERSASAVVVTPTTAPTTAPPTTVRFVLPATGSSPSITPAITGLSTLVIGSALVAITRRRTNPHDTTPASHE